MIRIIIGAIRMSVFSSYLWHICSLWWCSGVWGSQQLWCRWGIPPSLCLCCSWSPGPCSLLLCEHQHSLRRTRRGRRKTGLYSDPWSPWLGLGRSRTPLWLKGEGKWVTVKFNIRDEKCLITGTATSVTHLCSSAGGSGPEPASHPYQIPDLYEPSSTLPRHGSSCDGEPKDNETDAV